MPGDAVVRLTGVRKEYHSLRPLRINHLEVGEGETLALLGLDRAAAEVLVNMITGATLPDEGAVSIFGGSTRDITDTDAWFRVLDRLGILSERVVLLNELTVRQNLALPLSLAVDSLNPQLERQIDELTAEAGISKEEAAGSMATAGATTKLRVRLAKALALNPSVLLAEHPNALIGKDDCLQFGRDLAMIAAQRRMAMVVLTADGAFGASACRRTLTLRAATGELVSNPAWRRWFGTT